MPFSSEHFIIQPLFLQRGKVSTRLCHILLDVAENSVKNPTPQIQI